MVLFTKIENSEPSCFRQELSSPFLAQIFGNKPEAIQQLCKEDYPMIIPVKFYQT